MSSVPSLSPEDRELLGHLGQKAKGMLDAINGLQRAERELHPSWAFGQDYNRLRELTIKVIPRIEIVAPPPAEQDNAEGAIGCRQSFGELMNYINQLYRFINDLKADLFNAEQQQEQRGARRGW